MLDHKDLKELLDFGLRRIQSSAWTTDDVAKEILSWIDLDKERTMLKAQAEDQSCFSGKFYL